MLHRMSNLVRRCEWRARHLADIFQLTHPREVLRSLEEECLNIDMRIWLNRPHFVILDKEQLVDKPCVVLESSSAGIFYRYKTVGFHLWEQEVVCRDIAIVLLKRFLSPHVSRGIRGMSGTDQNASTLLENLSLFFGYSYNYKTDHSDVVVTLPLEIDEFSHSLEGIEAPNIEIKPLLFPEPKAVSVSESPGRHFGTTGEQLNLSTKQLWDKN